MNQIVAARFLPLLAMTHWFCAQAMAKALDFTDPDRMSMTVILTAMNRFINEADGSQTAFLDGNQPDRVCAPIAEHVRAAGGDVLVEKPLDRIEVAEDGSIAKIVLRGGEEVVADEYVSALPVDVLKRVVPEAWSKLPYFRQLDELEGIPVARRRPATYAASTPCGTDLAPPRAGHEPAALVRHEVRELAGRPGLFAFSPA